MKARPSSSSGQEGPNQSQRVAAGIVRAGVLAAVLGLLLSPSAPLAAQTGKAKDIALILRAKGRVQKVPAGKKRALRARKGDRLHSGDIIRTGRNSQASLIFTDDKSLVKLRPQSQLVIKGKREKKNVKKTLFMRLGTLWAKVTKGNLFRVETPSGVAAVKGTEFEVSIDQSGTMTVTCFEGIVELFNRHGKIEIKANMRGELTAEQAPEAKEWSGRDDEIRIKFEKDGEVKWLIIKFKNKTSEQE